MAKLHVIKMILGMVRTNCYLAVNDETEKCFIVDPADQAGEIERRIKELGVWPEVVLLTHGHFDHIGAASELKKKYGIPILAPEAEKELMEDSYQNLSSSFGKPFAVSADRFLKDGETISQAGFSIRVLHTPGHTKGGACYYLPEAGLVFSGDTLFYESVGRTDFPTGNAAVLRNSVKKLTEELPENTLVYPGHEMATDIAHEKKHNPFL